MNHRTMRSADVTQGYLHFGADELLDPATRIERAILEYAGLMESKKLIDSHLLAMLEAMSDSEKRALLFSISNSHGDLNVKK